jgi:hypothetical protein
LMNSPVLASRYCGWLFDLLPPFADLGIDALLIGHAPTQLGASSLCVLTRVEVTMQPERALRVEM